MELGRNFVGLRGHLFNSREQGTPTQRLGKKQVYVAEGLDVIPSAQNSCESFLWRKLVL